MTTTPVVRLERREEFAVLTLDRQEALNALSFAIIEEIAAALDQVARTGDGGGGARALIVTGAGPKAFCAGADIKELPVGRGLEAKRRMRRGQQVFALLDALPIPSVAVINGFAFGGGLELALACTFRLATRNARMGLPEIKLGLIPGYGGTQRLPRLIGEGRALELVMTGRAVGAEEAERIGLVNRLVEGDPAEAGIAFAREFAGFGLPALGLARSAVQRALDLPIQEGLKVEADLSAQVFATADAAEGTSAFVEKRKPRFRDA